MDRAYVDFRRLRILDQAGSFFVSRAKKNLDAHRVRPRNPANGILSDHVIKLDGPRTRTLYPAPLHRVRFRDSQCERTLVFLTNQMTLDAEIICALYKHAGLCSYLLPWMRRQRICRQLICLRVPFSLPASQYDSSKPRLRGNGTHALLAQGPPECEPDARCDDSSASIVPIAAWY